MSKLCLLLAIIATVIAVAYSQTLYCGYTQQLPHVQPSGTIFPLSTDVSAWIGDELQPCTFPPTAGTPITNPQQYFGLQCRYNCATPTNNAATPLNWPFTGVTVDRPWTIYAVCVDNNGIVVADGQCPQGSVGYAVGLLNRVSSLQCPPATCGPVKPACSALSPAPGEGTDLHPVLTFYIHEYSTIDPEVPTPVLATDESTCTTLCTANGIDIECDTETNHFVAIPAWTNQYCIRDITVIGNGWNVPVTHFYNPATTTCQRDAIPVDELDCSPAQIGAALNRPVSAQLPAIPRTCAAHGHQICAQSEELLDQFALSQQNTAGGFGVNLPRGVGFCADDAGWTCSDQDVDESNCVNGELRAFQTRVSECGVFVQRITPIPAVGAATNYFIGEYYQPNMTPSQTQSAQCRAEGIPDTERVAPSNACPPVDSDTITCPVSPTNPSPSCCKKQNVDVSDVNSGDNTVIIVNGGRSNQDGSSSSLTAGAGAGSAFAVGANAGPLGLNLAHTVGAAAGVEIVRNMGL